jgi:hypothetical protein
VTTPPDRKPDDDAPPASVPVQLNELDGALIEYIYDLDPRRPTLPRPLVAQTDDELDTLDTQPMRRVDKPRPP